MSSPRIELPDRAPDFVFNDRDIFGRPHLQEHFNLRLWDVDEANQGVIALEHAVGRPDTEKAVGSSMLHQSLLHAELFAGLGMRPALEAVGIKVEIGTSMDYDYTYSVRANYPSAESFCAAANTLRAGAGPSAMPLRFEIYNDAQIPAEVELSALADSTVLVPTSDRSYEHILNQGVASLALPLQTANQLKLCAGKALAAKDDRRAPRSSQRENTIQNAVYNIHGVLSTRSIVEFLGNQERAIRTWTSTLDIKRGPGVEIEQEHIRKHIGALGEKALLS